MYRLALAAIVTIVISAPQAFALSPLEDQARLTSAPKQTTATTAAPRVPRNLSRADRWRGAPYTRTENETLRREALDKRLLSSGEMPIGSSFAGEDDHLLRREALDKRLPTPDFGAAPPNVSFSEGDDVLRREALDKRMPLPNFGSAPTPNLGF
jgi:hypothetical protein